MAVPMSESPVCLEDFERHAAKVLNANALDYYRSGAHEENSLRESRRAFARLRLLPRMLRDVRVRDLSTRILGQDISLPVCIAPTAMQRMAHPDGETATARAAAAEGTIMTLSTIATSSIEEVATAAPAGLRWFQLYIYKDRRITESLVRRAEAAGFRALVLTVDTPMFGQRWADNRNRFQLPPHLRMANFAAEGVSGNRANKSEKESGLNEYASSLFDPGLMWDDVKWLVGFSRLPVVVKGVICPEDALLAVKSGASAVLVSNHGARQLDFVPATVEVLPSIVAALSGSGCEVYLDGGVRTGTDVLKALALGARAVFIGRPAVYGLAHSGEQGVCKVIDILRAEIDNCMALLGVRNVSEVTRDFVIHKNRFCLQWMNQPENNDRDTVHYP